MILSYSSNGAHLPDLHLAVLVVASHVHQIVAVSGHRRLLAEDIELRSKIVLLTILETDNFQSYDNQFLLIVVSFNTPF